MVMKRWRKESGKKGEVEGAGERGGGVAGSGLQEDVRILNGSGDGNI